MHVPAVLYQMEAALAEHLTPLRPAQRRGLALWVYGAVLAQSACQSAVVAALTVWAPYEALRQRLREWLYDGADKAAPCGTRVAAEDCFGPLLGWVLRWWQGRALALAIDATTRGDRVTALVVAVLYRGGAIPVAWAVLPGNTPGAWLGPILRLLERLQPAVLAAAGPRRRVLVLADRGLWSPRLWAHIRALGWHPLLRVQGHMTIAAAGRERCMAKDLVRPGQAWVGRGRLGSPKRRRLAVTLIAAWTPDQAAPWAVVTDLPPRAVGVSWYALRRWVELGFRALKGLGWQWQRTRRVDPQRVARHWLVLAVASLWTLAHGTRVEDAHAAGRPPAYLRTPPASPRPPTNPRRIAVFRLGLQWLRQLLARGRLWCRLWLAPEPWPQPPPGLTITLHRRS
jgi:hypothetical protein